jgi:glutamyl-Q tRNA(Asp) synthetase
VTVALARGGDRSAVFRFAPSPTGALHLGHARSALLNARLAAAGGGHFLLRIEDIDGTRLRPAFVDWMLDDLAWLGLQWETPVLRQSERMPVYAAAVERLTRAGLLYPCFASRTEIAAAAVPDRLDPDGAPLYPGIWRGRDAADIAAARAAGLPHAMRLDMTRALKVAHEKRGGAPLSYSAFALDGTHTMVPCQPERWGDVVLVRKETPTSYHLSVVVDDAAQAVTHVVRGMDLLAATDLHRLLQVLLDLPQPLYHHHALILDGDGRKLSKSAGAASLRDLRAAGVGRDDVIAQALSGLENVGPG